MLGELWIEEISWTKLILKTREKKKHIDPQKCKGIIGRNFFVKRDAIIQIWWYAWKKNHWGWLADELQMRLAKWEKKQTDQCGINKKTLWRELASVLRFRWGRCPSAWPGGGPVRRGTQAPITAPWGGGSVRSEKVSHATNTPPFICPGSLISPSRNRRPPLWSRKSRPG